MSKKITTEDFIERAKKIHGDKYDYSKTKYAGVDKKVCIICPKHGEFWQTPKHHIYYKNGCPACGAIIRYNEMRLSNEEFIRRAKEIHGEKYDYLKTNFHRYLDKITVTCPIHGDFVCFPNTHLRGSGCPKCAADRHRKTLDDFIKEANEVHGNKYDYSKSVYKTCEDKIIITCPIHGDFLQVPAHHLRGVGCPKCAIERTANLKYYTTDEFITSAKEKYKNEDYDYSKSVYKDCHTPITIICHKKNKFGIEHGEFSKTRLNFLDGKKCPKCSKEEWMNKMEYNNDGFIKRAREVHGDNYDYSKVIYNGTDTPVTIICPIHGEFKQNPYKHIHRRFGCPKCNSSHLEEEMEDFLKTKGIKYIYQKRFLWLGLQSLDFYLPDYHVGIECQGIQHFKETNFFQELALTKELDSKKLERCTENGVRLFYYSNLGIEYPYEVIEDKEKLSEKIIKKKNKT